MKAKIIAIFAALTMLVACESTPDQAAGAGGVGGVGGAGGGIGAGGAPGTQEHFLQAVGASGDRVFFDFDSSDLKADGRATIERWAQYMRQNPSTRFMIEGHCDERGTREYNLALGDRRATSAQRYLVSLGIDPARVTTISYGKERPAVVGSNEAAFAQNRRGVAVVN